MKPFCHVVISSSVGSSRESSQDGDYADRERQNPFVGLAPIEPADEIGAIRKQLFGINKELETRGRHTDCLGL